MSDLFEKPLDQQVRPLYMAQVEKIQQGKFNDKIKSHDLRLDMVADARSRGIKLSAKDLKTERDAWIEKRKLKQSLQ